MRMKKASAKKNWESIDFDKAFMPGIAIDAVIFGFHENRMKVLLLQYKNTNSFALPGGFIFRNEDTDHAAHRILKERTGLSDIYLEQFYTFGEKSRHDNSLEKIMKGRGLNPYKDHFLLRRFVSIGYYALVDFTKVIPAKDDLSDDCKWYNIKKIPVLIQDHKKIINKALETLREDLDKKLVGFNLMSDTFTMRELQSLYETILDKKFRRTSFQRKMLNLGILKKVEKKMTGGAHKAPYLYKFLPG
jgi:8-oxo-dGTP diphosphatase